MPTIMGKSKMGAVFVLTMTCCFSLISFTKDKAQSADQFPYRKAGLTEEQAVAHLLSRFTYGAKTGQIEEVIKLGPEKWFSQQLEGKLSDKPLDKMLQTYDALKLSNSEAARIYLNHAQLRRAAIKDGLVVKDSSSASNMTNDVIAYMKPKGYHLQTDLIKQFISQKVLRATYSNNQLHEILTEFWFNHFNVSFAKNPCTSFIPGYERDAIRPNVTGPFGNLLLATAQAPAMLFYLDNFNSYASREPKVSDDQMMAPTKSRQGLNENYAREVMELHTLGVDGGYTQQDVTEAARILTGWTVFPMENSSTNSNKKLLEKAGADTVGKGYVHRNDFLFIPDRHDKRAKVVLGNKFPSNGGYQEGVALLDMLAKHPSTAKFICRKLAVRFVSDTPPQSLIDKMVKTFQTQDGNIAAVLKAMVYAPEFWSKNAVREKTKSPFELAVSTVRSLDADVQQPYQLYTWTKRMGQNLYYYQAPTGFPDYARYWINTGALLNRMNFGLAIAGGRVSGVKVNLIGLNHNHEPESAEKALITYGNLIMPQRDLSKTVTMITPLLNDPELVRKVDKATSKIDTVKTEKPSEISESMSQKYMLAQVVGILIGSPEFQRR
jgi:uncharacterized protein (DUF1800 family)